MSIQDLSQPVNFWLADVAENLGELLAQGDDPSIELNLFGCEFEIRLNKLPDGSFVRKKVTVDVGGAP